ncbi:MAG: methyltransferase domain-containing protein [Alphaproteobacteria bacterium]|nr:methyltransferase domain-containing protein [Alphaproteobacteria bacterium]
MSTRIVLHKSGGAGVRTLSGARIFVSIASYRDTECQWTVEDLFRKASKPDRVFVGICWQMVPEEDGDCFVKPSPRPEQTRSAMFHVAQSQGVGWARAQAHRLWRGEDYLLNIDSHTRFVEGWDDLMIEQLRACPAPKPLLTTYPLGYVPPDNLDKPALTLLKAGSFNKEGILHNKSRSFSIEDAPAQPMPTMLYAAGFAFSSSKVLAEIPYDPLIYFQGEEIAMATRLWTHGWDLFSPSRVLLFHAYTKTTERKKAWHDNKDWQKLNDQSYARVAHLTGSKPTANAEALKDIDRYGLGSQRSIEEYQSASGINFAQRRISALAGEGKFPLRPFDADRLAMQRAFTGIWQANAAQNIETHSGPASTLKQTRPLRQALPQLFKRLGVRTLLDAGCGDANWIGDVAEGLDLYIGLDLVEEQLTGCRRFHAHHPRMLFRAGDITRDPLPRADMILCRDVLTLLPEADILKALELFRNSGASYLAATHFSGSLEPEGALGVYRQIDLQAAPFNLPPPQEILSEMQEGKVLGIWQIKDALFCVAGRQKSLFQVKAASGPGKMGKERSMMINERIFVAIPSYRDTECQWTIKDMFQKAASPDRVFAGICWQSMPEEDAACFEVPSPRPAQTRVLDYHISQSQGVGWARAEAHKLWQGEEYLLNIDSHTRFVQDWDERMLAQLKSCPAPKPLLTTYPPGYVPPDKLERELLVLLAGSFDSEHILINKGRKLAPEDAPATVIPSMLYAAGFSFSSSQVLKEVPYDPFICFIGEEISMALRLWTSGWDLFAPNEELIYHAYGKTVKRKTLWVDNRDWDTLNVKSRARVAHLTRSNLSSDQDVLRDIDKYALGPQRSFEDYCRLSGIDFPARRIQFSAREGRFPLCPFDPERSKFREAITAIWRANAGVSIETRSGLESTLLATRQLRPALAGMLERLGIRTLVDAGCGNVGWMSDVVAQLGLYIGIDIVEEQMAANQRVHMSQCNMLFKVGDITRDLLPRADMILCRDVLPLLRDSDITRALALFRKSGARYLAATHFSGSLEPEGALGVYRQIDLQAAPFNLPPPLESLAENSENKRLCIWRLDA